MTLGEQQKKLRLRLLPYELDRMWQGHELIAKLRQRIERFFPLGLYDPQDLEHQVLFRLTTYDPKDIDDDLLAAVVNEQYQIIHDRLDRSKFDLDYLFRGLTSRYHDLNISHRLTIHRTGQHITAHNDFHTFTVEWRPITDDGIVALFSQDLHYIHQGKLKGETFGFYFAGDELPWALETTEPSVVAKEYKRQALLAHGIDPNKAVELTRFYTLPGAPRNAISLMDAFVADYYQAKGIEALYTTTMPMYAKTKGTTVAGGLRDVLLVKDLQHKFIPVTINNQTLYRQVTNTYLETMQSKVFITSHPAFPMMPTVEVYRPISQTSLQPLPALADKKKVIYVQTGAKHIEQEIKFPINDLATTLERLRVQTQFQRTEYLRDSIYGAGDARRIRLRLADTLLGRKIEAMYKYKIDGPAKVKTEIEELIYHGTSFEEAEMAISDQGDFHRQNSYEKIRLIYTTEQATLTVDVYPYGAWLEIEGKPEALWRIAADLGYRQEDSTTKNADELYLDWQRAQKLPELWDVRFGLPTQAK